MNKTWIIISVVTVLLIGGAFVCKGRGWHHGMHNGKMLTSMAEKAAKKLDLDDAQKAKLDALVEKYQPRFQAVYDRHREFGEKLIVEFKKDTLSRETLESWKKGQAGTDMHDVMFDFIAEFHAILTPEQREKAAEHIARHMERHSKHRE